jgi:glycosyltransferase involved in cell wall biosynthesis
MKFTAIMPIHNEEQYLPYSLPSLYNIHPEQVILIFDRCTDKSLYIAEKISDKKEVLPEIIEVKEKIRGWSWQLAYLIYRGVQQSHYQAIFVANADVVIDPTVKAKIQVLARKEIGWVSFGWIDYPLTFENCLERAIQRVRTLHTPSGINYAFKRNAYQSIDINKLKKVPIAVDQFIFKEIILQGLRPEYFQTKSIHLRPIRTERHYLQGFLKYMRGESLSTVLFKSALYIKPLMVAGYLKAMIRHAPRIE